MRDKVYVIVSKWGYPFGGGEEFLYQTMEYASKLNMKSYWLSFSKSDNSNYEELVISKTSYGYLINIPGGFNKTNLYNWLRLLRPTLVHHQGHLRRDFYEVCNKMRIDFLSGFHFWSGGIILDPIKLNVNIIENKEYHKVDPELEYLYGKCHLYTASQFVTDCIKQVTGYNISDQIFASSSCNRNKIKNNNILLAKYVTLINIHRLKGGHVLLYLLEKCQNIPFICIKTESHSSELDDLIKEEIRKHSVPCIYVERVKNMRAIYQNTRILLAPSLADETFCRTVNEAMLNGIPVLGSGHGNIKYLMGVSGKIIDPMDLDSWYSELNNLYFNEVELLRQSKLALSEYKKHSVKVAFNQFNMVTTRILDNNKFRNIMIFTPWCDQGLGIQSRNYKNILEGNGFNVCIFALKPYNGSSCISMQKNPSEWVVSNIYYSDNNREHVTDVEIINFVNKYDIGICLLPETCWFRVFEVARLLDKLNVLCYAIPNIEIVRRDEVFKHRYYSKILCNNMLCKNIFESYGLTNTELIGYGISGIEMRDKVYDDKVKFLFIGGMNAFSRKHILDICEGFDLACKQVFNIQLICTVQMTNHLEKDYVEKLDRYKNNKNIRIITNHLTYQDIIDLYYESHVSIQVSKHEGLGLGFYEAVSTGTPVISLKTPPHNEVILDNINGWLIDCYYKKMTDNGDPLFDSAYFDPINLSNKIKEVVFNKLYIDINDKLRQDYKNRLDVSIFHKRFLDSLR